MDKEKIMELIRPLLKIDPKIMGNFDPKKVKRELRKRAKENG